MIKPITRSFLLLVLAILISSRSAERVEAGYVFLQADSVYFECDATDHVAGPRSIYVLHDGNGVAGVRFKLEASLGLTWSYLSEVHYAPVLEGDTQNGIAFCYGDCQGQIMLAKVTYMAYGTSEECSDIRVVPHPASNAIEELECDGTVAFALGAIFYISQSLPCDESQCPIFVNYGPPANPFAFCQPVRSSTTTWGAIKALYQH